MLAVKLVATSQTQQPMQWKTAKVLHVLFQITPSNSNSPGNNNPYVAGGDTLDLTQLFNTASSAPGELLPTFEAVLAVRIFSARPVLGTGYAGLFIYHYAPGTTLANGTMQIFTGAAAQAALTELSAGNYPTNVGNDVILAEAIFAVP
jgi:hypothetical protein